MLKSNVRGLKSNITMEKSAIKQESLQAEISKDQLINQQNSVSTKIIVAFWYLITNMFQESTGWTRLWNLKRLFRGNRMISVLGLFVVGSWGLILQHFIFFFFRFMNHYEYYVWIFAWTLLQRWSFNFCNVDYIQM